MYDSFDNTYQATIGIDFLSKVHAIPPPLQRARSFVPLPPVTPVGHQDGWIPPTRVKSANVVMLM